MPIYITTQLHYYTSMNDHHEATAPQVLSFAAAQEYLGGISRSTLKLLTSSRQIRSLTIGRRRLIPKAELDRYIAERLKAAS